jgi:hypothetical protein
MKTKKIQYTRPCLKPLLASDSQLECLSGSNAAVSDSTCLNGPAVGSISDDYLCRYTGGGAFNIGDGSGCLEGNVAMTKDALYWGCWDGNTASNVLDSVRGCGGGSGANGSKCLSGGSKG